MAAPRTARPRLLTRPPRVDRALVRPRLVRASAGAPLVVLYGPPGSGTTTAAAQLAAAWSADDGEVLWCRLGMGFNQTADVVGMVADQVTGVDDDGPPAADVPYRLGVLDAADRLLEALESFDGRPVTLVVDDYHLAAGDDLDRVVAEVLGLLPSGAHVVVAAATRPAGLVGRVAPGECAVIDQSVLAFTEEEAVELFRRRGVETSRAVVWHERLGGWAEGLAAGAAAPDGDPGEYVVALLERVVADDAWAEGVIDLASVVPYVTASLLSTIDPAADGEAAADSAGDSAGEMRAERLARLVDRTPVLDDHDGFVRLTAGAAAVWRARLADHHVATLRAGAGSALAMTDPTTAIEVLLDADEAESAADVLADHLSEIGVERALSWLYRLPTEMRRRFPPVLAAGRATVEVDAALAAAQVRVERAVTPQQRREALFALGSIESHRGELGAAAGAFEGALRVARDDGGFVARVALELAETRWLLGDLVGSRSALVDAPDSARSAWIEAQIDVVEAGAVGSAAVVAAERFDESFGRCVEGLAALVAGRLEPAEAAARAAYAIAAEAGGEQLAAAGPLVAWVHLRRGHVDDALLITDEFERRLGPRHQLGRVHGALIRERGSRGGGSDHERDERRLRDLRSVGYSSVERLVGRVLDDDMNLGSGARPGTAGDDATGVVVGVLGTHRAEVGDRSIRRSDWKSKKAFEVLTVLAGCGSRGARREQLIEAVWPGREADKGRTLLRTALAEIRRVLEPGRPAGEPSRYVTVIEDVVRLDGALDVDRVEGTLGVDPSGAFAELVAGVDLAVGDAEWATELVGRVDRLCVRAAGEVPDDAPFDVRVAAAEVLFAAEPWQRAHVDLLVRLHRSVGDESAVADIERRWFADD